jgi:hypothetical protein
MRGAPCRRFSRRIFERRLDADDNRVRRIWLTPKGTSVLTLNCPVITHAASTLSRAARARLIFSRIAAPSAFQV